MLIDSHCHLDPTVFGGDDGVDDAIARARAAGVDRMVTIGSGYGFESAERALAVARRHPETVRASVGLHPHDAKLATDASLAGLIAMADAPEVLSGVSPDGLTLGSPIAIVIRNGDQRPQAYAEMKAAYRPSHADYTYDAKYGIRAVEGGGRSSAGFVLGFGFSYGGGG